MVKFITVYGRRFPVVAEFKVNDEGVAEANAYMAANPGASLLVERDGMAYLANMASKGEAL